MENEFKIILKGSTLDKLALMIDACLHHGNSKVEIRDNKGKVVDELTLAEITVDVKREITVQVKEQLSTQVKEPILNRSQRRKKNK